MSCALYRYFDARNMLLYVGISNSVLRRLEQHHSRHWFFRVVWMRIDRYPNRDAAMRAERIAIRTELPLYNRQLKPRIPEPTEGNLLGDEDA